MKSSGERLISATRYPLVAAALAALATLAASVYVQDSGAPSDTVQLLGPEVAANDESQTTVTQSGRGLGRSAFVGVGSTQFERWTAGIAQLLWLPIEEFSRAEPEMLFTGSVSSCTAGSTNPEYRESGSASQLVPSHDGLRPVGGTLSTAAQTSKQL